MLDNSPLSGVYFARCFPLPGLVWKFSWHCLSQRIIFKFNEIQFGVLTKKSSPNQRSSRFSPIIFSRSFIVSCFTFRSMIYFELIFVKSVKTVIFFFFLHVVVQLSQHSLLKRPSFSHCVAFVPLSKISWLFLCASISRLSILVHWSLHLFFSWYHTVLIAVTLQ